MSSMNPVIYIPLFSAILTSLIGFYVFLLNPKKKTNRVFSVLALFLAIFSIGEFITRISTTKEEALFFGRICYIAVVFISCLGVHFSTVFPKEYPNDKNIFPKYKYLLFVLYVVGIIIAIIFSLLVSPKDVEMSEWGYRVILNPSTGFIIHWLLFCSFIATVSLSHTYFKKHISNNEKKQIQFVTVGFLLVVALSLGTNLVPPLYRISVFPMTTFSLLIFSVVVAFSMKRYKLMKLTIAETADAIIDTMSDSLIVVDKYEKIVNFNKSTINLLGYHKEELINSPLKQILKLPEGGEIDSKKIFKSKPFDRLYKNRELKDIEADFVNKAGNILPMSVSVSAMYDNIRNLEGIVLVARDLTEIKKSLTEKDALLREIHHRVKNNLQLISSLLDLQSEQTENKKIIEMFRESQNRIKLMASLHEQLYQSKNLDKIDLSNHIKNLLDNLFSSYTISPDAISLKINVHNISMDFKKSLLLSMIVSELVSNSLKHAFPTGEKGEIIIDIKLEDNSYTGTISDNGVGLPKGLDFRNTNTLGLQLINMFVKQLKGSIQLDKSNGTKFIITFRYIEKGKGGRKDGK